MRALLVLLVVLVAAGCGASDVGQDPEEYVYRVRFHIEADPSCPEASCVTVKFLEWVAPSRGWWRTEWEDATGFSTTEIYAKDMVVTDHNDGLPSVRIGSPAFLGYLTDQPIAHEDLQASETWTVGDTIESESHGKPFSATIEERITLEEAERRGLFAIPNGPFDVHRELAPGERPTLAVRPYWFGPTIAGREAVSATEARFTDNGGQILLHTTYYERPSAAGPVGAQAGKTPPPGAIQVRSQPTENWFTKTNLQSLAREDRMPVILANGERADVICCNPEGGATVVTRTTLLSVWGVWDGEEALRLAHELRPL
jgi:hypothetical protein